MKTWKILNNAEAKSVRDNEDIIRILLKNRGVEDAVEFLSPKLDKVTLKNVGISEKEVEKTLRLITKTINDGKSIIIYGDYDVDGISATAILWETLYAFYKNVLPYIPHRVDEGYGLSIKGIERCKGQNENVGLIITVDNGIVANKAVDYALSQGIDVVVTDHHTKGEVAPKASAIVHTVTLCGTGIAYLLAQEITKRLGEKAQRSVDNHLELVALATVADLVPLNIYNRTLLKFGLEKLRNTKRPGLLSLFEEAKIDKDRIEAYHIGHMIAPRLNASGRITHALDSLRLLCTKNERKGRELARHLHEVNRERQQLTFDSAADAKEKAYALQPEKESLIFVESEEYEQGVIGLIAAKLVEEFYKPAIAVSVGEKISKGSARSVPGVNIIELIRSVPELLSEAGGHPMAAGFSIETSRLKEFKEEITKKAKAFIDKNVFDRILTIDMELSLGLITIDLYEALQALQPFGMGNPQPVFSSRGVTIASLNKAGKDGNHLQVLLEKDGDFFKGIKFSHKQNDTLAVGRIVDVAYMIDLNVWKGNKKVELNIKDMVIS